MFDCTVLERSNFQKDDYPDSLTYLTYDNREKNKKKYVMKIFDLEKLNNLTEFIVRIQQTFTEIQHMVVCSFFFQKDILWYRHLNHPNLMSLRDCFLMNTKLHLIKPHAAFGREKI